MLIKPTPKTCKVAGAIVLFASLLTASNAISQTGETSTFKVDVELDTAEVIAIDKQGNPVSNLKKEDFQLYEDGKKQEILSVDEMMGKTDSSSLGALPFNDEPRARGKIVLIIFAGTLNVEDSYKRYHNAAANFVRKHMSSQDQFAVASYTDSMKILQNFTGDKEAVLAAINLTPPATSPMMYRAPDMLNYFHSLTNFNRAVAGVRGVKTYFIFGQMLYTAQEGDAAKTAYAEVLATANTSNVVMNTINPAGCTVSTYGASPIKGLDPVTSRPTIPASSQSPVGSRPIRTETSQSPFDTRPTSFGASPIGGRCITNINDLDSELDAIGRKISHYYILGYRSDNPKRDGGFRKIKVKTNVKGIELTSQNGYIDRRAIDSLSDNKQEKALAAAIASPEKLQKLPVIFRPAYFYDSSSTAKVIIKARILAESLALNKIGKQLLTDINWMGAAYAENGAIAARFSETRPISIEKSEEDAFRKKAITYQNYFKLRPGKYRIKIAVSNESNSLGTAEQVLDIPALPEQGITASSITVAESATKLADLIRNMQVQLVDGNNPLLYAGTQIEPSVENRAAVNAEIPVFFWLYNLPPASERDFAANARLINADGTAITLDAISLKQLLSPAGANRGIVLLNLPSKGAPAGKYQLVIDISNADNARVALLQTDLELI